MNRSRPARVGSLLSSLCVVVACSGPGDNGSENVASNEAPTFEEFVATLPVGANGAHLVEGDIPLYDQDELLQYYRERYSTGALVLETSSDGVDTKYTKEQALKLTYCVSNTFGADKKAKLVAALATATKEWVASTKVNGTGPETVKFSYVPEEDASCDSTNPSVFFDVSPMPPPTDPDVVITAQSFFPKATRSKRTLFVGDDAFPLHGQRTLTGVLRHELGHALGFRHEHINQPGGPCAEAGPAPEVIDDKSWRALTPYDVPSVMHYRLPSPFDGCYNTGATEYTLTTLDSAGVRCVYTTQSAKNADGTYGDGTADACRALTAVSGVSVSYAVDASGTLYRLTQTAIAGSSPPQVTTKIQKYAAASAGVAPVWSTVWTLAEPSASATKSILAGGSKLYRVLAGSVQRRDGNAWVSLGGSGQLVVAYNSGELFRLNSDGSVDRYPVSTTVKTTILPASATTRKLFAGRSGIFRIDTSDGGKTYQYTSAGWSASMGSGLAQVAETESGTIYGLQTDGRVMLRSGVSWSSIGTGASAIWGNLEQPYMTLKADDPATPEDDTHTISRYVGASKWLKFALSSKSIMKGSSRRVVVNTNNKLYAYANL